LAGPSQSGNLKRLGSDHDLTEDRGLTPLKSTSESKKRGHFTVPPPFFVSASGGFSHFALLAQAEIAFDDTRIARQFFGLALEHHLSRFEHIAIIGHLERSACVLLHQQDGNACAAQTSDDMEDFAHN